MIERNGIVFPVSFFMSEKFNDRAVFYILLLQILLTV